MANVSTRVSLAEFQAFLLRDPSAERRFELIDGEIIESLPTEEHSIIAGNLYAALRAFVKAHQRGRVLFEARHERPGDHAHSLIPDVEFTRAERVQPILTEGVIPYLPDLVIEIKSPTDRYADLRKKALYYLENGVELVWLVYPAKQQVEVWTDTDTVKTFGIEDTLSGGEVLPGFTLPVRDLFTE